MLWYSHLLKNIPQFVMIYIFKGFSVVNEGKVDVFFELFCFFYDPMDVGNAKVGSQELPGLTGKFGLGVHNEEGQRLTVLLREHTGCSKHPFPTTQETSLHMDITK